MLRRQDGPVKLEVRVLGSLEVLHDSAPVRLTGLRAPALLSLLTVRLGHAVSVEEALSQVWGPDSERALGVRARNAVQARVSALRRALGSTVVRSVEGGYLLDVPPDTVDSARFDKYVRRARALRAVADAEGAMRAYRRGLQEWRGPPAYDGLLSVPALQVESKRLAEVRLQMLQEYLALHIEMGRYEEAAPQLANATSEFPGVEEFWALRMLGLYHQGRQAEAMAVYAEARTQLRVRFGLDPGPRLRELVDVVLHQRKPSGGGVRFLSPTRIPRPATSFVGRDADLHTVVDLLASSRLVTLTGPGGVGKTRLALEAAQVLVDSCSPVVLHGVTVIDVAGYQQGDDLAGAVLDRIGLVSTPSSIDAGAESIEAIDVLADLLADRRLLLVLDNCEHVADAVAELSAALLARTPATTLLATSRELLDAPGEDDYVVAPLTVPARDNPGERSASTAAALAEVPAVRLFLDRALPAHPRLPLGEASLRTVVRICRHLDGLPLAMELAAVRAKVLGIDEAGRLLDDRFRLPSPAIRTSAKRHQTLQAAIDWSYDLLDEEYRIPFARLSAFQGSFSLRQAQQLWTRLGGTSGDALIAVEYLVSRSMVQVESGVPGSVRFRLLETIRMYAADRLADNGEQERTFVAHARVYATLVNSHLDELKTEHQAQAVAELMIDDANMRMALTRSCDGCHGDLAQALCGGLGYIAWMRGGRNPSWDTLVRAMELPAGRPEVRMRALAWATHLGSVLGHLDEAVRYGEECATLAAESANYSTAEFGFALLAQAHALHRLSRWDEGDAVLEAAQRVTADTGDLWTLAGCAMVRGLGALVRGWLTEAETQFVEANELYRTCQDRWGQQRAALRRSVVREARGDYSGAAGLLNEALEFIEDLDQAEVAAPAWAVLARATLFSGDIETARRMVLTLTSMGVVGRLTEVAARLEQCRAVLAEYDGDRADAVRMHLAAADRLADARLPAEAVESWARVVLLSPADGVASRVAAERCETAARNSVDPRVHATAMDVRAQLIDGLGGRTNEAEAARAAARTVRDRYGLAVPMLLRPSLWSNGQR